MIRQIFGTFDLQLALQLASQVILALFLGGMVGLERERQRMPAGVRTFIMVSLGSCIFTILSYRGFIGGDPGRVAAQIVTGIGFLGAGVTIQRKGNVYGLTSAAAIWATAAVGMAVGTGRYFLATFCAVTIVVVMGILRRWFKADALRATRRTLNIALRRVRSRIAAMGQIVEQALKDATLAVTEDDHVLARQILANDEQVNELRYQIEEECLDILRSDRPAKIQLRTVLAATHIATNLERMGDYAKEIAQIRLQIGHAPLPVAADQIRSMAEQVCSLLEQVLAAYDQDDIETAQKIGQQASTIDRDYQDVVETVTTRMSERKNKRFEQGASLLNIAYHLKRAGERVTNIAERIVFVRTGTLIEIERDH
jgi:phosphate transport system regulatory protein PhoU